MGSEMCIRDRHWVDVSGKVDAEKLPRIYLVNWFRRNRDGGFAWPGFGENSRVLKWVVERLEGRADAQETPIGFVPTPESLDLDGVEVAPQDLEDALKVDREEWAAEAQSIQEWFDRFGDSLPDSIASQLEGLKQRLGA